MRLFPHWDVPLDTVEGANTWYKQFKDLTNEEFTFCIEKYIKNECYYPTVGGIRSYLWEVKNDAK